MPEYPPGLSPEENLQTEIAARQAGEGLVPSAPLPLISDPAKQVDLMGSSAPGLMGKAGVRGEDYAGQAAPPGAPGQAPDPMAGMEIIYDPKDPERQVSGGSTRPIAPPTKEEVSAMRALYSTSAEAAKDVQEELAIGGQDEAKVWGSLHKRVAKRNIEYEKRIRSARDALAPEEKEMLYLAEDLKKMKVNPDKWWADRSTPQKIAAVLSMALGGFVEGFTGGRIGNSAAKMITRAIDRDIAAQKANIVAKQGALSGQKGIVAYYAGKVGDVQRAEGLARQQMMEHAKLMIGKIQAQTKSAVAIFNGEVAKSRLNIEGIKTGIDLKLKMGTRRGGGSRIVGGAKVKMADGRVIPLRTLERALLAKGKIAALRKKLGAEGARKVGEPTVRRLANGSSSFAKLMRYFDEVLEHKKSGFWSPTTTLPDVASWISTITPEKAALYRQHMEFAMAAVRDLSGAQAARIETAAQKGLQPQAIHNIKTVMNLRQRSILGVVNRYIDTYHNAAAAGYNTAPYANTLGKILREVNQRKAIDPKLNQKVLKMVSDSGLMGLVTKVVP